MGQGQGAGAVLVKSGALWAVGRQWDFIREFILHILCGGMCLAQVCIGKQNSNGHSSLLHGKCNLVVETVSRHINRSLQIVVGTGCCERAKRNYLP